MTMIDKKISCPFCHAKDSAAVLSRDGPFGTIQYFVMCGRCLVSLDPGYLNHPQKALNMWLNWNPWTSADSPPETDEQVLVFTKSKTGNTGVHIGYYSHEDNEWHGNGIYGRNVTHWMPKPIEPKEKQEV